MLTAATAILAACDDPSPSQRAVSTSVPEHVGSSTASLVPAPATTTLDPSAPSIGNDPELLVNRNDPRTTALGRLCWARREVVLALVGIVGAEVGGRELEPTLDEVVATLATDADLAPLPEAARPFSDEFDTSVVAARDALAALPRPVTADRQMEIANTYFVFDSYPGAADYVAATASDTSCREP